MPNAALLIGSAVFAGVRRPRLEQLSRYLSGWELVKHADVVADSRLGTFGAGGEGALLKRAAEWLRAGGHREKRGVNVSAKPSVTVVWD